MLRPSTRSLTVVLALSLAGCCCAPRVAQRPVAAPCAELAETLTPMKASDLAAGDEISIVAVRGDDLSFRAGGNYCIHGRCTLRSVPAGVLEIVRLENVPVEGSVPETLGRVDVRGTGEFVFHVGAGPRKMFGFELRVVSPDGSKRLGTFSLMNWGC